MKHRRALVLAPILALTVVGASGASAFGAVVPDPVAPTSEIAEGLTLAAGEEVPEPTLTETSCTVDPANLPPEGATVLETVSEGGESATSYDTNGDGEVDILLLTVTDPATGEARFFVIDRDRDGVPDYAYESSSNTCYDVSYPETPPVAAPEPTPTLEATPTLTPTPTPTPVATPTPTSVLAPAPVATTPPSPSATPFVYADCDAVRTAINRQILRGEYGYGPKLDSNGDGVGCENLPATAPRTSAVPAGNTDGSDLSGESGVSAAAVGGSVALASAAGAGLVLLLRRRLAA